jgi:hypothetical protein
VAFLLVSARTGRAHPDGDSRCMVWPDFVRLEITDGEVEPGFVLNLDALPADYVCTVKQIEAATVPPELLTLDMPDGSKTERRIPARIASQREATLRVAKVKHVEAFSVWVKARGDLGDVESALNTIDFALAGVDRSKLAPSLKEAIAEAEAAKLAASAVEQAAKVTLETEATKPVAAQAVAAKTAALMPKKAGK